MTLKRLRHSTIIRIAVVVLIFWAGWQAKELSFEKTISSRTSSFSQKLANSPLLLETLSSLERSFLEKERLQNEEELIYGAIEGTVAALGDPYTAFLPPKENQEFKEDLAGSFSGVGIQLGYKNDQLAVIAPLEGSPALRGGVRAGDIIIHIKDEKRGIDENALGLSSAKAVEMIRGPKGSPVTLTVIHEGEETPVEITLIREEITVPSVELTLVEKDNKKIAHLKLTQFGDRLEEEWSQAVSKILASKNTPEFAGIILDLRNNPGGYLDGAVYITSEFLSEGIVVQQDEGKDKKKFFSVNHRGQLTDAPLVVLINRGSASASEIVAGALRENKETLLVGETSFGKGTIQESRELTGGAGLHITVARWLLPGGECIDKVGLKPDIEVKDEKTEENEDPVLEKALEELIKKS
ncbi:S41 family peptidase [Candidatus Shapirobacteria bacterium]|nr:S41 family peptidase [Candidatus Shapirobacteria bacterium]